MTEDVKEPVEEIVEPVEEVIEPTEEYSALELAAMEKGWNPDKDSVPEGKPWIDAGEFVRNESFFDEIRKLKRSNKSIQKSFDILKEHHKKVDIHAREEALKELKRLKVTALEEDNHAAVVDIDDKILDIKSQKDDPVDMQEADNGTFDSWVEDNGWYESNSDMRQVADDIGNGYFARMQGKVSPEQVYDHVTKQIKKMYPEEFGAPVRKRAAAPVEGAKSRGTKAKQSKYTERDLSDEQRKVMNNFVKSGVLTKEAYIQELVAIGELV